MKLQLQVFSSGTATTGKLHQKEEMELTDSIAALETLVSSSSSGFLNLHWLLQSLDVLLASHTHFQRELQGAPRGSLDAGFVSEFMDDSGKLMEACNALRRSVSSAGRSKIHVKYVIRSLVEVNQSQIRDVSKMKKLLQECIGELETSGSHTGSWLLLQELISLRPAGRSKRFNKRKVASKASEAKVVSVLVLTALFASFSGDRGAPAMIGEIDQSQRFAPGFRRYLQGIREEVEDAGKFKPVIVLEALCSSLKQILIMVESQSSSVCKAEEDQEHQQQKMKLLVQQASKKLEYFESGLGIVEEQLQELFAKLVANRNLILSASSV